MNDLSNYSQTDQLYKETTGNPTRIVPRECLCRNYLRTQCGSREFLLLRGAHYSINRKLPQCKLPLNKQSNDTGILFIKGLVLRQINSKGTTPVWVSAPSLILIVINEMEHIFSNSARKHIEFMPHPTMLNIVLELHYLLHRWMAGCGVDGWQLSWSGTRIAERSTQPWPQLGSQRRTPAKPEHSGTKWNQKWWIYPELRRCWSPRTRALRGRRVVMVGHWVAVRWNPSRTPRESCLGMCNPPALLLNNDPRYSQVSTFTFFFWLHFSVTISLLN